MIDRLHRLSFSFTCIILTVLVFHNPAFGEKGHLVIIGGGDRPGYLMEKISALAPDEEPVVRVIPNASGAPIETAEYQVNQFAELGIDDVDYIYLTREQAQQDSAVQLLHDVDVIFFSGGDQRRLVEHLGDTPFLDAIHRIYEQGGVISGTSAGAAVMSNIMITGDEHLNEDEEYKFTVIKQDNIITREGFGFISSAIIDQHFITRKRHNRLISLVLAHPELVGIGIDESTAIVVAPDKTFQVLGENTVLVYDAHKAENITIDDRGNYATQNLQMHLLQSGQRYDLQSNTILD